MRGRRALLVVGLAALLTSWMVSVPAPPAEAQTVAHSAVVSDDPANFTPHVLDGKVNSIVQVGNTVILGGAFSQVQAASGGAILTRNNVVAFNATTGAISTTFVPNVNGEVTVVLPAADGQSVYFGGFFNSVNGATRTRSLARVNLSNGAVTPGFLAPVMNSRVKDLRLAGGRLWVAGTFATIANQAQPALATVNPNTGAFDSYMDVQFADPRNGGVLQVLKMDVTPAGDRLVAIGNFNTVGGLSRQQVVILDLTGPSAEVANWGTRVYEPNCASVFDSYMRDLDVSPDGSFFVISTTGAYRGFANNNPCDTTIRWETYATGDQVQPTWLDYTGGDTSYAVAITGSAVYVGGHFRWQNNPYAGDRAGAGAVAREGIAALDPANGLPLAWNPGRAKGVGVFDMLATATGLWVGSDTDRIGGWEYHGRIAFFPLAGGTTLPAYETGELPGHVFLAGGQASGPAPGSVLHRVNAGGPVLPTSDTGPDWAADNGTTNPLRTSGSNAASWVPVGSVDGTVPGSTPSAIFDTERWDPSAAPALNWSFAVASGTPIQVRLYFANRCDCTNDPGERRFDITLDGTLVLDDFDIAAAVGHNVGTMRSFDVTSDGTVNIDFAHVTENPLINGIEIVRTDIAPPAAPSGPNDLRDVFFDGTDAEPADVRTDTGIAWGDTRGSVMIDGDVYTGYANGSFSRRSFDGTTFGPALAVDTHDQLVVLDNWRTDVTRITGMFFDNGRLYYTVSGSASLFYRYFTPSNSVIGALRYTASGNLADVEFNRVSGMFLEGGHLYYGSSLDGTLRRVDWNGTAPVAGTATTVGGPAIDGNDWRSRGMFLYTGDNLPGGPTPNQPPTADASITCLELSCDFDGTGSSDPDGTIASYSWDFDDGTAPVTTPSGNHTYTAAGTYTVALTVTDNDGAPNTTTRDITVSATPPASDIAFVGQAAANANWTSVRVTVPAGVAAGDALVLVATTATTVTVGDPTGFTQIGSVAMGGTNGTTTVWSKVADAGDPGRVITVTLSAQAKTGLTLLAYRGTSATDPVSAITTAAETVTQAAHTTPGIFVGAPGSVVVSYWADRATNTTSWTPPIGETVRAQSFGAGGGHISVLATDSNGPVPTGDRVGLTATANSASARANMISIVLAP